MKRRASQSKVVGGYLDLLLAIDVSLHIGGLMGASVALGALIPMPANCIVSREGTLLIVREYTLVVVSLRWQFRPFLPTKALLHSSKLQTNKSGWRWEKTNEGLYQRRDNRWAM